MVQLWNSDDCAEWFRCTQRHFMEKIAPQPGFPTRFSYPTVSGRSRPVWDAESVRQWTEKNLQSA